MRIERVGQPPPPPLFTATFTRSEGWAIVAALRDYAGRHPNAADRDKWIQWADDLDHEMRL